MITAGCTVEKIDNIRNISNISTGKLGSLIADSFAVLDEISLIYYICNKTAVLPQSGKIKVIYITNVLSLEKVIMDSLEKFKFDIIIHSMAVSDYYVRSVTSISNLASLMNIQKEILKNINEQTAENTVNNLFYESASILEGNQKINSNLENILLLLEKTKKIISIFQIFSPYSILVGFKLLDTELHETLINKAYLLLQENNCNFVLANDLSEMTDDNHIGYLIDKERKYQRFNSKQEIANGIVNATINKRNNL